MIERARRVWRELAGAPAEFGAVVVAPGSRLCPPGWVGVVVLGGEAIVTVPVEGVLGGVRQACASLTLPEMTDAAALRDRLPIRETLGPATLAYCDRAGFRPVGGAAVRAAGSEVAELVASVPADEAGEAGLDEITSPAYVVRDGDRVVAAAGYGVWAGEAAHVSVLTAPSHRGRGLARVVASAAVGDAFAAGLLPQWRARPASSRRVALALGFTELGAQLSFRV
jgi:GNAT superfamily N-acetyltransferase